MSVTIICESNDSKDPKVSDNGFEYLSRLRERSFNLGLRQPRSALICMCNRFVYEVHRK